MFGIRMKVNWFRISCDFNFNLEEQSVSGQKMYVVLTKLCLKNQKKSLKIYRNYEQIKKNGMSEWTEHYTVQKKIDQVFTLY